MIDSHKVWAPQEKDLLVIDNHLFNLYLKRLILKCQSHNEAVDIAGILSDALAEQRRKHVNRMPKLPAKNKAKRRIKKRPRKTN